MIDLKFHLKNNYLEIASIFILILIVLPGMIYYNQNNYSYTINPYSTGWSPDRTKMAFIKYNINNRYFGEIMVWSKNTHSFQFVHNIADYTYGRCLKYKTTSCFQGRIDESFTMTFSPDNKLLAVSTQQYDNGYLLSIFIYNLTTNKQIGSQTFSEDYGFNPITINWINTFYFASNKGIVNLLTNKTSNGFIDVYPTINSSFYSISNPKLSPNGVSVALNTQYIMKNNNVTVINYSHNIFIQNVKTNSILANISNPGLAIPIAWSSNNSELFYRVRYSDSPNRPNGDFFYGITPDFQYLTIAIRFPRQYNTFNIAKNTNSTYPNPYYTNPEVNLVFTGNEKLFKISSLPNLDTIFSYKFDNGFQKIVGIGLVIWGIIAIVLILAIKNHRKIRNFF